MTTPNPMLAELDEVVRLMDAATPGEWSLWGSASPSQILQSPDKFVMQTLGGNDVPNAKAVCAALNFLRTHHATLADMARRLEAAERDAVDARRYRWLRVRLAGAAHVNELEEYNQTMHSGLANDVDQAIDATQEGKG